MRVNQINSTDYSYRQNFGHTFRVGICLKKADNSGYEFVNPATDKKLYKKLNSKIVSLLNEDFIAKLRTILKKPETADKKPSVTEALTKRLLVKGLYDIDSDYRQLNLVRSVYRPHGLAYIATGVDVSIIENLKGAAKIGVVKSDAIADFGFARNPYTDSIVENYYRDAARYVKDKKQQLYSENGKEIMLRVNFKTIGKNKKGKDIYELESSTFHEVKKSTPVDQKDIKSVQVQKSKMYAEIKRTIRHLTTQITGTERDVDLKLVLNSPRPKPVYPPQQLELEFKE